MTLIIIINIEEKPTRTLKEFKKAEFGDSNIVIGYFLSINLLMRKKTYFSLLKKGSVSEHIMLSCINNTLRNHKKYIPKNKAHYVLSGLNVLSFVL